MKLLASDIQSRFTATTHVHCYRTAIEELVYNALDAKATSVAIRIHIQGESIKVIDNGTGVRKTDMSLIGLNHMTSKTINKNSLQSAPNTYGYRGQALGSIIGVAKTVKITSRIERTSDTFVKVFYKGKEKDLSTAVVRASKGTTIEIQGFLYNLKIQKANINSLQEIQEIKQFLERLSLVHQGLSISLRDDSKNEIIFKIHKSRDLYQTMETLFGIDRKLVQELKVEKKEYKLTAFIGKKVKYDNEVHWIFLNGRFIAASKLNDIVDRNMEKALCLKREDINKKAAGQITEESNIYKNKIPFYLIFLSCPYNEYDINFSKKQAQIEFKNWDQIRGFIDKLVKFYRDTSQKLHKVVNTIDNYNLKENTKEEVNNIVKKFLASNSKKLGISQTRNGLKGKLIKRHKTKSPTLSKMSSKYKKTSKTVVDKMIEENIVKSPLKPETHQPMAVNTNDDSVATKVLAQLDSRNKLKGKKPKSDELALKRKPATTNNDKLIPKSNADKTNLNDHQPLPIKNKNKMILTKYNAKNNKLLNAFKKQGFKVQKRCNFISEKTKRLMKVTPKQLTKFSHNKQILFSQAVHYTQVNGTHSVPIKKTIHKTYNQKVKSKVNNKKAANDLRKNVKETPIFKNPVTRPKIDRKVAKENNTQPPGLTFQSHNYEMEDYISHEYYQQPPKNTSPYPADNPYAHFITTESRDNFDSDNHGRKKLMHKSTFKISRKGCFPKKRDFHRGILNIQHETSYTIEFTDTMENSANDNDRAYSILNDSLLGLNKKTFDPRTVLSLNNQNNIVNHSINENDFSQIHNIQHTAKPNHVETFIDKHNADTLNAALDSDFQDYNCISYKRKRFDINNYSQNDNNNTSSLNVCKEGYNNTYSLNQTYDLVEKQAVKETVSDNAQVTNTEIKENAKDTKRINILFLSNSQESIESTIDLHPLNFCETLLGPTQSPKSNNNNVILSDELNRTKSREITLPNELLCDSKTVIQAMTAIASEDKNKSLPKLQDEISHHFQKLSYNGQSTYPNFDLDEILNNLTEDLEPKPKDSTILNNESITKTFLKSGEEYKLHKETGMALRKKLDVIAESNFDIKNRPCFLPKGLSPIYENCNSKKQCNLVVEDEYFNNTMYDDFVKNVEINVELFQTEVQNVHEMATKNIEKVNARIKKDNASLCFDGSNLKDSKILGQVDNKFIAAKLRTKTSGIMEHLVLFDQHAVHERIRLENNLKEYVKENQWKSVELDEIVIKLSQDDILYLHNYRDKFYQLGLNWSNMSDREVCINAIPEAILGKNPRQVEIIMKAVKSLILEEIESLKLQKGSLKLYPKAIMDLVFSEACRYAIKFGDPLSKDECIKLIQDLCKCKSPFQCAHGRPVMAVVMDIKPLAVSYKVNMTKLNKFKIK